MNKILIRSRDTKEEIVQSYPFFYRLHEIYPEAEVNILVAAGLKDYFAFLPFRPNVYEIPQKKETFFGNFHYAMNLHDVFNVDLYFDFIADNKSSMLGVTFKASERIGLERGINKLAYHKKVKIDVKNFYDSHFFKLLEEHLEGEVINFYIEGEDSAEETDDEEEVLFESRPVKDYILVFIDCLDEIFWSDLFDQFDGKNFIFWRFKEKEKLEEFFHTLDERNRYEMIDQGGVEVLDYYLQNAGAVLTNQRWFSLLCSIKGKKSYLFLKEGESECYSEHVRSLSSLICCDEESIISIPGESPGQRKEIRVASEVVDLVEGSEDLD